MSGGHGRPPSARRRTCLRNRASCRRSHPVPKTTHSETERMTQKRAGGQSTPSHAIGKTTHTNRAPCRRSHPIHKPAHDETERMTQKRARATGPHRHPPPARRRTQKGAMPALTSRPQNHRRRNRTHGPKTGAGYRSTPSHAIGKTAHSKKRHAGAPIPSPNRTRRTETMAQKQARAASSRRRPPSARRRTQKGRHAGAHVPSPKPARGETEGMTPKRARDAGAPIPSPDPHAAKWKA